MSLSFSKAARWSFVAMACAAAAGCGSLDRASRGIASVVTPYKVEVVQGNVVSKEQVAALRPGMTRVQVRDILGSALITDVFHRERWDYVFSIRRDGKQAQPRRLAVFFRGDALERWEGDEMPSEAEFVATLDNKRKGARVPQLEASEEKLRQFAAENKATPPAPPPPPPPAAVNYPPLEPQR